MIISLKDRNTESLYRGENPLGFPPHILRITHRKLSMIAAASILEDLRVPPGNHLEQLKGTRKGQHSIRINDQWRICFIWEGGNALQVQIVDYH